ncbi:MAG: penicillin-binding protein 1A [Gammaproteobacteria bacterium]|nr:penicillin-binding protein 1A [Gammaproteobacteria bacterium]
MVFFQRIFKFIAFLVLIPLGIIIIGSWYYIEYQLPDIEALNTVQLQVPLQVFSRDSKLIAEYGEKRRIPVPYDQIPQELIHAVLATEDQRYFQHPGIDIPGLVRASMLLIATGHKVQGGSTITMQVARSFYLTRHKTFGRKLREIFLALKIDHRLSKQKILELYLNKIFLGNRAYGVAAAAQIYYGKTLDQLTLDEAAMLAGLPKAPSTLNPLANPVAAKKRRDHVLTRMYESGYIDAKALHTALAAPLNAHYHEVKTEVDAPWFGEMVRKALEEMYGDSIYTDGFNVYTTLDSKLQEYANQAVLTELLAYDQRHGYRGPEKNFGTPDLLDVKSWEKKLANIPAVNTLEPAIVIDITSHTATVLRANGQLVIIPWEGLSWARRQINADYLGPRPHTTKDILKLGDLVRIVPSKQTGWRLAQIPQAQASLVTLDPSTGGIRALVGGFDFQQSNFNRITNATRQPGSSFKPFLYSAALDKGYTLATLINDAPVVYQNPTDESIWRPQNAERRFYGPTRLRDGLIHSHNLVSIRLLEQIRVSYAINYATRFGFVPSQLPAELSLALGTAAVTPLQMAAAYAIFANGGFRVTPYAIEDTRDTRGKILYQARPLIACQNCPLDTEDNSRAPRVISAENAFLITSVLHDVIEHGTASEARTLKRLDLAGKTGTTQNQVDAWFIGYNPSLVTLAWVGFDQPQSLHEYGAQAALPIWMAFMKAALQNESDTPLDQPSGITNVRIDPLTGKRATARSPVAQFEYFMRPYVPDKDTPADLQAVAPASQQSDGQELY